MASCSTGLGEGAVPATESPGLQVDTGQTLDTKASTGAWHVLRGAEMPDGETEKRLPLPPSPAWALPQCPLGELQEGRATLQFPEGPQALLSPSHTSLAPRLRSHTARKWQSHATYSRTGGAPNHSECPSPGPAARHGSVQGALQTPTV